MKSEGFVAATLTAFHEDGSVDYDAIPAIVTAALEEGCIGVFINGTTGEGLSLSIEERKRVAEAYSAALAGRAKLIVHVGANALHESCALAEHAAQIKADAFSSIPPFYQKPSNIDSLVACMAKIAQAAPDLSFYYYHIPGLTGVNFSMFDFMTTARGRISNLVGLKFSSYDLADFNRVLRIEDGVLDCFFGCDQAMLSALVIGCKAFVGSSYGVWGRLFAPVMRNFYAGDIAAAQTAQAVCTDAIAVMDRHGGLSSQKAVARDLRGLELGPYRLPLIGIAEANVGRLMKDLQDIGFDAARS